VRDRERLDADAEEKNERCERCTEEYGWRVRVLVCEFARGEVEVEGKDTGRRYRYKRKVAP
jgi:hypothetical protein